MKFNKIAHIFLANDLFQGSNNVGNKETIFFPKWSKRIFPDGCNVIKCIIWIILNDIFNHENLGNFHLHGIFSISL